MIQNLAIYGEWKKNTLKRLTAKYRTSIMKVFEAHLRELAPQMELKFEADDDHLLIDTRPLVKGLKRVLERHQEDTVHVAVSDGMREVDPTTKLSSWENWSINVPIEDTFKDPVELKKRDSFSQRIAKKIREQNKKTLNDLLGLETKKYLAFVRGTFRSLVADYFENEDTDDTKDLIKDALTKIFKRTDANAETMFRTETTRYFNDARVSYFKTNTDVDFVQLVAVTDGRISDICECRDGYVIPIALAHLRRFRPPFHPNCRTVQSPLDTDLTEDAREVRRNLGREFGRIKSKTSDKDFRGERGTPRVPLPPGWA